MNAFLQTLLEEFRGKMNTFTGGVAREIQFPMIPNKIMVAIGMRRTGKTYLLFQVIQNLLKTTPITRILYINFEDDRLLPITKEGFRELVDGFYTLYPENHDHLCYLFFDEIQNVDQWHTVIRRYFDTKKVKIYLTGSSAKLLSKEIATSLRGRSFPIEVWPFSFSEFLKAKKIDIPAELHGKSTLDKLKEQLNQYLEEGGFPESVLLGNPFKKKNIEKCLEDKEYYLSKLEFLREEINLKINEKNKLRKIDMDMGVKKKKIMTQYLYLLDLINKSEETFRGNFPERDRILLLQDYVSTVIQQDIVERYHITNISLIRYMIKFLLKNVGCSFSVNKFFNDMKSQGFAVGKGTIHDYMEYISDAYLAFTIPLYTESLRKMQTNPKKIFAIDTGLVRAYTIGRTEDIGHHFENLIYLDLKRSGHEVFYYLTNTRREVDFIARDGLGKWHLYQVCWNMNDPETLKRETSALEEAEKETGIKGEIITQDSYFTSFLPSLPT